MYWKHKVYNLIIQDHIDNDFRKQKLKKKK